MLASFAAAAALPAATAAKGLDTVGAAGGMARAGSPYRYQTVTPIHPKPGGRWTTVLRTDRHGGRIGRWWRLRGSWIVPSVAFDRSGASLSGDGSRLILAAYRYAYSRPDRWTTRFAVLDTGPHSRQRSGGGSTPLSHPPVRRITLRGDFSLAGVSPHGETAYVVRHVRPGNLAPPYEVRALDTSTGRLLPGALFDTRDQRRRVEALPAAALSTRRWNYTLYYGGRSSPPYLQALDTAAGRVVTVALPEFLEQVRAPLLLRPKLADRGRRLAIRGRRSEFGDRMTLVSVDRRTFAVRATAPRGTASPRSLSFLFTPRGPHNLLGRAGVVGRSTYGRAVRAKQWGDPARPATLVVGCIHGDECAASELQPRFFLSGGCPDPAANLVVVPDLDPDGRAAGTRLNGDGVDLNRNFAASWRPIGRPGDLQYSGPRPFSEPESRLAARLVRAVEPRLTIWFHQHQGPGAFVRAWGQSAPAGRRFARQAGIPFHLLPWPDGTAPNWQNHRFPGTSSYVVELPPGPLGEGLARRLGEAIARTAHEVGEDGDVTRKG